MQDQHWTRMAERRAMLLVPGPRAGTPGLRMTHAAVTDLALQLLPCIADLHRTFSTVLTTTARGLRTVRTGYAYQPPACRTY